MKRQPANAQAYLPFPKPDPVNDRAAPMPPGVRAALRALREQIRARAVQ